MYTQETFGDAWKNESLYYGALRSRSESRIVSCLTPHVIALAVNDDLTLAFLIHWNRGMTLLR